MEHNFSIRAEKVWLVPMEGDDFESYRLLRNRPENRKWFLYSQEISSEAQCKWARNYRENPRELMFSIYDLDRNFIGGNSIYHLDDGRTQGEYGRLVIDKNLVHEPGYGVFSTNAVIRIAKYMLNLEKLELEVLADNIAAIKTYQKCGFSSVGEKNLCNRNLICMELRL